MSAPVDLKAYIRDIPDFPKPGIVFKDITPLMGNAAAFKEAIRRLADQFRDKKIDAIAAAEARGFLIAAPLALEIGAGLIPIRKPGKLPYATLSMEYQLEYGRDKLEVHSDALKPGSRILMVDDVLATGGTMKACCDLVKSTGAEIIACAFLLELTFLHGRIKLENYPIFSVLTY